MQLYQEYLTLTTDKFVQFFMRIHEWILQKRMSYPMGWTQNIWVCKICGYSAIVNSEGTRPALTGIFEDCDLVQINQVLNG